MDRFVSPKALAQAIGASESSLKRWADNGLLEVTRTAGGHRRIPIAEAVRFIRTRGMRLVRPDAIGLAPTLDLEEGAGAGAPPEQRLAGLLTSDKLMEARGLITALYIDGCSIAEIADGPIAFSLEHIGDIWNHDKQGILIEHRATQACIYALNTLRALVESNEDDALQAIGCSLSGDPYMLPSLIAAAVVAESGFRATNFGSDLPVEVLHDEVCRVRPTLVWISVSTEDIDPEVITELIAIADDVAGWGGMVVLGGRHVQLLDIPPSPAIKICSRMKELADIATWLRVSRSENESAIGDTG